MLTTSGTPRFITLVAQGTGTNPGNGNSAGTVGVRSALGLMATVGSVAVGVMMVL